jgi:hypothetical protein
VSSPEICPPTISHFDFIVLASRARVCRCVCVCVCVCVRARVLRSRACGRVCVFTDGEFKNFNYLQRSTVIGISFLPRTAPLNKLHCRHCLDSADIPVYCHCLHFVVCTRNAEAAGAGGAARSMTSHIRSTKRIVKPFIGVYDHMVKNNTRQLVITSIT